MLLGADADWDRWLARVAPTRSSGTGSFRASGDHAGELRQSADHGEPVRALPGLSAWGTLGGLELAGRVAARLVRIASDAAPNQWGNLASSSGDTNGLRLVLEGSRGFAFGGALRYPDAGFGLTAEAAGRMLLAHEDAAYREWDARPGDDAVPRHRLDGHQVARLARGRSLEFGFEATRGEAAAETVHGVGFRISARF